MAQAQTTTTTSINSFQSNLLTGLKKSLKQTGPPLHLYDDRGSKLYAQITKLDSYYLATADRKIFEKSAITMANQLCRDAKSVFLLELGSGDGHKTKPLILACAEICDNCTYIANDICSSAAETAVNQYETDMVQTKTLTNYYEKALEWMQAVNTSARKVVIFGGSTLGNMDPSKQRRFLHLVRQSLRQNDFILLGIDTKHHGLKPVSVIETAYRDTTTEHFIKNILVRANQELSANFDVDEFSYHASYRPDTACVEMWLISDRQQYVTIAEQTISFEPGEAILIERSHKFSRFDIERLAKNTGFQIKEPYFAAPNDYFLNVIMKVI